MRALAKEKKQIWISRLLLLSCVICVSNLPSLLLLLLLFLPVVWALELCVCVCWFCPKPQTEWESFWFESRLSELTNWFHSESANTWTREANGRSLFNQRQASSSSDQCDLRTTANQRPRRRRHKERKSGKCHCWSGKLVHGPKLVIVVVARIVSFSRFPFNLCVRFVGALLTRATFSFFSLLLLLLLASIGLLLAFSRFTDFPAPTDFGLKQQQQSEWIRSLHSLNQSSLSCLSLTWKQQQFARSERWTMLAAVGLSL